VIKVGVTGGIGSGKSYVCSIIEHLGFPVFYSDKVAKDVLISDEVIKSKLIDIFGSSIYQNNQLDKVQFSQLVFSDRVLLKKVNAIIHPRVRELFHTWSLQQNSSILFNEAAILFETDSYKSFDATILVTSPLDIRIQRIIHRDGLSESDIMKRMDNQWNDDDKKPLATYCIVNDDKTGLLTQIEEIITNLTILEKKTTHLLS
jgi:dephospho-CoA kinase